MRSRAALMGLVALVMAGSTLASTFAWAEPKADDLKPQRPPKAVLNTLVDIRDALRACWEWPRLEDIQSGMDVTILLSFKRNGEIFGARLTHESKHVSPHERDLYYRALAEMMRRCSPLPFTDGLGNAVAGRPFTFRFHDTRKEKKA